MSAFRKSRVICCWPRLLDSCDLGSTLSPSFSLYAPLTGRLSCSFALVVDHLMGAISLDKERVGGKNYHRNKK
jgi:hypothetical protein